MCTRWYADMGSGLRETCAPVVNWASVYLILANVMIHGLSSTSIESELAYSQADLKNVGDMHD